MRFLSLVTALAVAVGPGCVSLAAGLVMPAAVPAPSQAGDLVGFKVQNAGTTTQGSRVVTFGQAFAQRAVRPDAWLQARDTDASRRAQMDVLATYPDGSVRFAAITTRMPQLAAGATLSGVLTIAAAGSAKPIDLAQVAPKLIVALKLRQGSGTVYQSVDLGAALQRTLSAGRGDFWLRGPCATQARVDVPISGALHITADITAFDDGSVAADVQFNNDLAMTGAGGTASYDATITLNGVAASYAGITQRQYQDWHAVVSTNGASSLNVQHDLAYLQRVGAVLPYDRSSGVAEATLQGYAGMAKQPGFGRPLAANGVMQYMPTTGGRPDIGYTTQYSTVWLLTQDARAATVALAQGDTGGAVPWNLKLSNGHWLTPGDYLQIWSDPRGGPNSYTTGLTQQINENFGWQPDPAHQPDLAFVPYLMTGSRWYQDRLNAQAAYAMSWDWPGNRCVAATCDILTSPGDQVRAAAWSMREIQAAASFGKAGTFESTYFARATANNWGWLLARAASVGRSQGQSAGWLPGTYGSGGSTAEWEQDYLTGVVVLAAQRGDAGALQFLNWQRNWVVGRFSGPGMNPRDGCTYNLAVTNPSTGANYTTWAAIEAATVAGGLSNGRGWAQSNGDYCQLARAVLGGLLTLNPGDSGARAALTWLAGSGAPLIDQATFQADPTFNVVPLH